MNLKKELWYDARMLKKGDEKKIFPVLFNQDFDGIMISEGRSEIVKTWPQKVKALFMVTEQNLDKVAADIKNIRSLSNDREIIAFSENEELLRKKELADVRKGIYTRVEDKESMEHVIKLTEQYKSCIIEFTSTTNIPLELILAFSQKNKSEVCKVVDCAEAGWIATMTMEMGSYSVLLKTDSINDIVDIRNKVDKLSSPDIEIKQLKVTGIKHIGMGERICIDTTSKLNDDEGMIIGSTSTGGILVSSETHYLPYMELRPFRVNAGALHSYVWCDNNYTKYMSELKVGDEVMTVNSKGETRKVSVGRIKMERRPLLLIHAESNDGKQVNTIVQDDWHIRIIGKDAEIKNSTMLKEGDIVLGYTTKPGRHIGVEIQETIIEK